MEKSHYNRFAEEPKSRAIDPRNVLGRLRLAIGILPVLNQKLLACDFVEHAWHVVDRKGKSHIPAFIETLRQFVVNGADIAALQSEYQAVTEDEWYVDEHYSQGPCYACTPLGSILRLLKLCCCQRELEDAAIIVRSRYQPNAFDVAVEVATTAGRPPQLENEWQLQHTVNCMQHLGPSL